jgi:hypothetical protein
VLQAFWQVDSVAMFMDRQLWLTVDLRKSFHLLKIHTLTAYRVMNPLTVPI